MIIDFVIFIVSAVIGALTTASNDLVGDFHIWPDQFLTGLTYFFEKLMAFNIFVPVDSLLTALVYLSNAIAIYISARLFMKLINLVLGRGEI